MKPDYIMLDFVPQSNLQKELAQAFIYYGMNKLCNKQTIMEEL